MPRTAPIRFAEIRKIDRDYRTRPCPICRRTSKRRTHGKHRLWDLGGPRPVLLEVRYSVHFCKRCRKYFSASCSDLAEPLARFTHRVKEKALASVLDDRLPLLDAQNRMLRDFSVYVPRSTLHRWVLRAGEKNQLHEGVRAVDAAAGKRVSRRR